MHVLKEMRDALMKHLEDCKTKVTDPTISPDVIVNIKNLASAINKIEEIIERHEGNGSYGMYGGKMPMNTRGMGQNRDYMGRYTNGPAMQPNVNDLMSELSDMQARLQNMRGMM